MLFSHPRHFECLAPRPRLQNATTTYVLLKSCIGRGRLVSGDCLKKSPPNAETGSNQCLGASPSNGLLDQLRHVLEELLKTRAAVEQKSLANGEAVNRAQAGKLCCDK